MPGSTPSLLGVMGEFAVRRQLGRGIATEVLEVVDRRSQQRLAVKLVRSRKRNASERQALEREFRALRSVQHPNIARCYELFLEEEDAFFTMELVEGSGFVEYVRSDARSSTTASAFVGCGPTGIDRVRRALPQLVRGIDALHAAGLVHRDLHPGNVRVTFGGRVVVIDYGLATTQGTAAESQDGNATIGSAAYAAPEQHEHEREPASDWYSIGVLLFEALTGALPFAGNDHEVIVRKRTLAAPAPRSLVPELPADLDSLCGKLLEQDPQARPNATAILERLGEG